MRVEVAGLLGSRAEKYAASCSNESFPCNFKLHLITANRVPKILRVMVTRMLLIVYLEFHKKDAEFRAR